MNVRLTVSWLVRHLGGDQSWASSGPRPMKRAHQRADPNARACAKAREREHHQDPKAVTV